MRRAVRVGRLTLGAGRWALGELTGAAFEDDPRAFTWAARRGVALISDDVEIIDLAA